MARKRSDADIIATAKKRFTLAENAESDIRKEARIDLEFVAGEQWDANDRIRRQNGNLNRPCLTFNKLTGPLNQVSNEARMNSLGIEVHPVDSSGDEDTANVYEGMIRHIEYASKADQIYETALEQAAACSFAYFEVCTQYVSPTSFDQELRIEGIPDQFSVLIDPFAMQPDKSDMRWGFKAEWVPRDDYENEYPDSEIVSAGFYDGMHNPAPAWVGSDGVRVAKYWEVELIPRTLVAIEWPDGHVSGQYTDMIGDELPPGCKYHLDANGEQITRETESRKVVCYKINGVEVLKKEAWPGRYIPILCVLGKEMWINGKRRIFSLIRFARDAQRLYNFYRSQEAEVVMLGTKAPWIGAKGIFKDPRWETANVVPWAYLEYEPKDIAGNPANPPIRNTFEPPIQALSIGAGQASEDIKSTTNVFDASLGAPGPESSGIAIQRRQNQIGVSNFHFIDNLKRAIRQCGVILCDLIPRIYDTAREVQILGEDRKREIVTVNARFQDERGKYHEYDLSVGDYDVAIEAGPSYATQRQEGYARLAEITQAYPQFLQVAGDLLFQNADFPNANKIAERFKKTLPAALQDQDDEAALPPAVTQRIQSDAKTIEQLTAALKVEQEKANGEALKIASQNRIDIMKIQSGNWQAALKAQVDLMTADIRAGSTENISLMNAHTSAIQHLIGLLSQSEAPVPAPAIPGAPAASQAVQ